jgi:hypothetical protein
MQKSRQKRLKRKHFLNIDDLEITYYEQQQKNNA